MKIGVLAVQGDFAAHKRMLTRLDARSVEVRRVRDLDLVDGLVMPGGESTTMLKFLQEEGLTDPIIEFADAGNPVFGTCAGAILLARAVAGPAQPSLALLDITIERNAYGRQIDSFVGEAETGIEGGPLEAVFIRAPRIRSVGPNVDVIARTNGEPVLVRQGNVMAATFHPELGSDQRVHRYFLSLLRPSSYHPFTEINDESVQMGRH